MLRSRAAATTPLARVSQRRMPPKMLIRTAFTLASLSRMRNAFFTCSALAPPPTSRKFAGLPPAYLMISMVAIARPANFLDVGGRAKAEQGKNRSEEHKPELQSRRQLVLLL